jgi:hypothetical protein
MPLSLLIEWHKNPTTHLHRTRDIPEPPGIPGGSLAAALLVLDGTDAERAWSRVTRARGLPVPDTDEQRRWVTGLGDASSTSVEDFIQ